MASWMKEDEKHEKIIRGLLKLSENKKCINCNSLGPQYVCTNFWTFVCITCSGIHREFTHRVKSISMAKFTPQEISALQAGGNENARKVYFKEWDQQRHFLPKSSNVERLRGFIKHVYVDRRYTGEKSIDKYPSMKSEKETTTELTLADTLRGEARSPSFEELYERRHIERSTRGWRNDNRSFRLSYDGRSNPGYDIGNQRCGSAKKSPRGFEVVDDRFRDDDRVRNRNQSKRIEHHKSVDGISKSEDRLPGHQKDADVTTSVVRPVKDNLGENAPPLRLREPPKADGGRSDDSSAPIQRSVSSTGLGCADRNSVELKKVNTGSLIDFDADPEPPPTIAPNDPLTGQSAQQSTRSPLVDRDMWASFGFSTQEKTPQPPSNASMLETELSQLSAQTTAIVKTCDEGQSLTMQQQTADTGQPTALQRIPQVGEAPDNQSPSAAVNAQGPLTYQPESTSHGTIKPSEEASTETPKQAVPSDMKQTGRKELPMDLFTVTYSPMLPVPVPGWHTAPFGMQYPTAMAMPTFPQPSKSTNPFDLNSEPTIGHSPKFPSITSMQGSFPNMADCSALLRTSSFGTLSPHMPHQLLSYPSTPLSNACMLQQPPSNMPSLGNQGLEDFGHEGNVFGAVGMDQWIPPTRYSQPATPNSLSSLRGNPFG